MLCINHSSLFNNDNNNIEYLYSAISTEYDAQSAYYYPWSFGTVQTRTIILYTFSTPRGAY